MSGWPRIYYKLLNLPLSVLVKSKSIPAQPAQELGLDTSRPIMYVLPYNSKADLLTLRAQCLAHDLPDPLEPLEIDGTLLPHSQLSPKDGQDQVLAPWVGGTVPSGQLFLHSSFRGSYDSRYFGPVPEAGLLGLALPVLTFSCAGNVAR